MNYIRKYLKRKCSGQLQELFSLSANPYKEISESMAAFENMREFIDIKSKNNLYICIGDGSLCLTSAMFAFMTHGRAVSIDPLINTAKVMNWYVRNSVKRFSVFKNNYQDVADDPLFLKYPYDLILVHAHVKLKELVAKFPNWRYLYTNPCCNPITQTFSLQYQQDNHIRALKAGRDENMVSDKNEVVIYQNIKITRKKTEQPGFGKKGVNAIQINHYDYVQMIKDSWKDRRRRHNENC
jgi:hypothetical protein